MHEVKYSNDLITITPSSVSPTQLCLSYEFPSDPPNFRVHLLFLHTSLFPLLWAHRGELDFRKAGKKKEELMGLRGEREGIRIFRGFEKGIFKDTEGGNFRGRKEGCVLIQSQEFLFIKQNENSRRRKLLHTNSSFTLHSYVQRGYRIIFQNDCDSNLQPSYFITQSITNSFSFSHLNQAPCCK